MAGSGRVVAATTTTPVPLSSKTKTSSSKSSSSSRKSIMTEGEASLFDPFGIASSENHGRSLFQDEEEEEDVVVVHHHQQKQQQQQQQHSDSSPSSSIDPFGIGFTLSSLVEKDTGEQNNNNSNNAQQQTLVKTLFHYSSPAQSPRGPPEVSRVTRPSASSSATMTSTTTNLTTRGSSNINNNNNTSRSSVPVRNSSLRTIPPKLQVRMTKYEEVSSQAFISSDDGGGGGGGVAGSVATVSVEGSLYVQVQGSDALKNAPFALKPSCFGNNDNNNNKLSIKPNTRYTTQALTTTTTAAFPPSSTEQQLIVHVPKTEIGFVPVIHYSFQQTMAHLPVLLERKVTIHETSCRIALQVRSKLTNKGDLRDFCLAVAIPEHVDASTVEILRGNGTWDPLVRLIKFRLDHLPKGASFMVAAQAKLWKPHRPQSADKEGEEKVACDGVENGGGGSGDPPIVFPVMLRCSSSEDQMSDVEFDAVEAPGIPCSITSLKAHSFRLLHRLT